jgi:hypothetical protein
MPLTYREERVFGRRPRIHSGRHRDVRISACFSQLAAPEHTPVEALTRHCGTIAHTDAFQSAQTLAK